MKNIELGVICFINALLIGGCGGGSSSDDNPLPRVRTCTSPATTTDRYLITSYDSCDASDNDLTGIWVIVADYHIRDQQASSSDYLESEKKRRMTVVVSDNEDGTLNLFTCNSSPSFREFTVSAESNEITFFDQRTNSNFDLTIMNNVEMTGALSPSSEEVEILRSELSAVKIADLPEAVSSRFIGDMDLSYTLDNDVFSEESLPISCASQEVGTTDFVGTNISFAGESLAFVANLGNAGATEEIETLYGFIFSSDEASGEKLGINLNFSNGKEIEAEEVEGTDAVFLANDHTEIRGNATVVDDVNSDNSAEMDFRIFFESENIH